MRTVSAKSGCVKSMPPGQSCHGFSFRPGGVMPCRAPCPRDQRPFLGGILDGPGLPAIAAAGQQVLLRLVVVDGVSFGTVVLVIAGAEADQDLVAPRPDAVIGRPAAEPARLGVDLHVNWIARHVAA